MGAKNRRRSRREADDVAVDPRDPLSLVLAAERALGSGSLGRFDDHVLDLVVLSASDGPAVRRIVEGRLIDALTDRWTQGWTPRDLDHVVRQARHHVAPDDPTIARVVDLLAPAVAASLAGLAPLAEPWASWTATPAPLVDPSSALSLEDALRLDHLLRSLDPLQQLGPHPGQAAPAPAVGPRPDDRVLEKVRRLLAKAESTTFEAEAEAFTEGAQRLMSRHRIDHALLAAAGPEVPAGRRVWLETPYTREKMLLLSAVADANGTRSVWAKDDGHVTLLGFDAELDAVETLYTSLLVQATRAMHAHGRKGGERTRDFRASFLAAYATRIGERLAAADAEAQHEATASAGRDLVPVLAAREEQVDRWAEQLFGPLESVSITLRGDAEGWATGRAAADQARLGWGRALDA